MDWADFSGLIYQKTAFFQKEHFSACKFETSSTLRVGKVLGLHEGRQFLESPPRSCHLLRHLHFVPMRPACCAVQKRPRKQSPQRQSSAGTRDMEFLQINSPTRKLLTEGGIGTENPKDVWGMQENYGVLVRTVLRSLS